LRNFGCKGNVFYPNRKVYDKFFSVVRSTYKNNDYLYTK